MVIRFKINMLLDDEIESIIYPLTEDETENLIRLTSKDFLNIQEDKNIVTLNIDVLFEDIQMINNIIQLLADMFSTTINKFKINNENVKNITEQYIKSNKTPDAPSTEDIDIEVDKFFMIYYVFMSDKDSSNLNRNLLRKMKKLEIVTINCVPLVKRVELTTEQFIEVRDKAINKCKEQNNFFILDGKKTDKEKWTNDNTDYNIYLYKERSDFVQNEKKVYYVVLKPKNKHFSHIAKEEYTEITVNHQNLFNRCRLFKDICDHSLKIRWKQILGLLSNIKNVKIKFDNTTILSNSYIAEHLQDEQKQLFKTLIKFIKINDSSKIKCNEYCPYKEECHHAKCMINTVHIKKDEIVKLDREENYITVEEARKELREKADKIYNNLSNGKKNMGVLIGQAGIGKTELVIKYIIRSMNNGIGCIYAVPNRKTIENFIQRLNKKGFSDYIVTPTLDDITDEKIQKEIKYFQNIGAYNRLKWYLHKLLKENKVVDKDYEIVKNYIDTNKKIQKFNGLIITTHQRFPYFSDEVYKNRIAFVDEDIFDSDFVRQTTMPLKTVDNTIYNSTILKDMATDKLNDVKELKDNVVTGIYRIEVNPEGKEIIEKQLIDMRKNPVNIFEFLDCIAVKKYYDGYKYKIKCFNFSKMPNIPIFITSATAEKEFYKIVFEKERKLEIEEVRKAKYEGSIVLWDSHTYSFEFMSKEENLVHIEDLINLCKINNMNLVTFKEFIKANKSVLVDDETTSTPKLLDGINCYNFFSILGLDSLKDNDLAVIGKPLKNQDIFYFLAFLIYNKKYGETTIEDERCKMQIVEDKGFLFHLYTYNDETLRKIQMWSISSNEEQYVGRARAISNENRIVYLASGYPVEQMDIKDEE